MARYLTRILLLTLTLSLLCGMAAGEELPVYQPVTLENTSPAPIPLDQKVPYAPHASGWLPDDGGYLDSTISVRIEHRTIRNTAVHFAWIQIADASQFRTASWRKYPSKQEVFVTSIAEREKAVFTINGDFCVDRTVGVVIRNGKVLREVAANHWDGMAIDTDGNMHTFIAPTPASYRDLDFEPIQAFVFGPVLVKDGTLVTDFDERLMQLVGGNKKAQRVVLCQMGPLSYLIICSEGPEQSDGGGFTIPEIAQIAYDMGAKDAFNLDGGSSAWFVLGTKRLNAVRGKKRTVTDAICFVTAEP